MTATLTGLRPMTDAEGDAAALHLQRVAVEDICTRTGLTRAQVAAAVDLSRQWAQTAAATLPARPGPKPKAAAAAPVEAPVEPAALEEQPHADGADDHPAVDAEPEPVAATAEPGIEQLLARAEASPQSRVRTVAGAVRTQLAHLAALLDNDERVRVLCASIEVMRQHLARDERELAELLGDAGAAPDGRKSVDWQAALADGPGEQPPGREPTDAELAHSPEVRAWAKAEGWEVGDRGRMAGAVVAAYRKAKLTGGA